MIPKRLGVFRFCAAYTASTMASTTVWSVYSTMLPTYTGIPSMEPVIRAATPKVDRRLQGELGLEAQVHERIPGDHRRHQQRLHRDRPTDDPAPALLPACREKSATERESQLPKDCTIDRPAPRGRSASLAVAHR